MNTGLFKHLDSILLALWVGGIWTIGYVVAPVLFTTLADRSLAALVAGKLFSIMATIGLYSGSVLMLMLVTGSKPARKFWWIFVLYLVGEALGRYFTVSPLVPAAIYIVVLAVLLTMQLDSGYYRLWQFWVLAGMLLFTAIGYFYLTPAIEAMRQSGEAARASPAFRMLHGTASILYLLTSLAGLALVIAGIPRSIRSLQRD